ncbi:hypothetical protein JKP88DRAFT_279174 [Tribonema minus]|uniref:Uncharacterized protein n=1 Tax=Tribonema minus TaxID=303371 RepID=A0A835YTZ9_9STRA|nr:hypothetical protein JKP88DRAFT_279174 [Tribonema minus]
MSRSDPELSWTEGTKVVLDAEALKALEAKEKPSAWECGVISAAYDTQTRDAERSAMAYEAKLRRYERVDVCRAAMRAANISPFPVRVAAAPAVRAAAGPCPRPPVSEPGGADSCGTRGRGPDALPDGGRAGAPPPPAAIPACAYVLRVTAEASHPVTVTIAPAPGDAAATDPAPAARSEEAACAPAPAERARKRKGDSIAKDTSSRL